MSAFLAVYLRELLILKHRWKRQLSGMTVSPFLYMLTFGYALGGRLEMNGHSYLEFLLPGLVAMASMTQAFGIAVDINVSRFYFYTFEEIQSSPVSRLAYVMGEIMAGLTRAAIGIVIILALGLLFGVRLHYGPFFWLASFLNGFAFVVLVVALAMLVKSHADQSLLTNFIITPMAFLGGTFFPLDSLPTWAQGVLQLLPLTHATQAIRADVLGQPLNIASFLVLGLSSAFFLGLALYAVGKSRD